MIDTLLLSGCGSKGNCFIGVLNALIDKKIIELDKIVKYICCSSGSLIGFNLCCGIDLKTVQKISNRLNYKELYDLDDLNDLFVNQGLFNNKKVGNIIRGIIKYKYDREDITLKEFYDLTKVEFICKVYNLSKKINEYISYKNYPELSVITLIRMTTCIPIFFKPIIYNDEYYIDGGITGNMPFIKDIENYIGIYVCNTCDNKNIGDLSFIEYVTKVVCSKELDNNVNNKNIIKIDCFSEQIGDFDISDKRKLEFINKSYKIATEHIDKLLL